MHRLMTPLLLLLVIAGCQGQRADAPDQDCEGCPEMVSIAGGSFWMGTAEEDRLIDPRTGKPATNDGPRHRVEVPDFAIGRYEVSVAEYRRFVEATGHTNAEPCMEFSKPDGFNISKTNDWDNPGFEQTDSEPVGCVSWFDAVAYTDWLSEVSGRSYRLPTEAEWEYAARAGSDGPYFWGRSEAESCGFANVRSAGADTISKRQAESDVNDGFPCDDGYAQTSPAGSYAPNAFGLYDTQGNNWEWVLDCNHKTYDGAPTDGSAWIDEDGCRFGVIRGGSFLNRVERSSVTVRAGRPQTGKATNMGFRVVRAAPVGPVLAAADPAVAEATASSLPGAAVFRDHCEACHTRPTEFEGLYGTTDDELFRSIKFGGNNVMSMPAFADRLSDDEISQVVDYLQEQNGW